MCRNGAIGEAILLPQRREGCLPLLLLGTRDATSCLPRRICPHATQPFLPFGEQRIVEGPSSFQVSAQAPGLPLFDDQGQFEQKGRGPLALLAGILPGICVLCSLFLQLNRFCQCFCYTNEAVLAPRCAFRVCLIILRVEGNTRRHSGRKRQISLMPRAR